MIWFPVGQPVATGARQSPAMPRPPVPSTRQDMRQTRMQSDGKNGYVVVGDRPQISIELTPYRDVKITVAGIAQDFESVSIKEVDVPLDCVEALAKGLLKLLEEQR
ncbi:hypothetical protein [Cupriavidus malaysiensis]|uniref:Uncharacterized protein n=1 Tax=Cupriavidus malaysiensis TaxID=367825 RepID=A0ABN4THQ4_9BURK|nr:hypothetical protein [Cupriavidus malaysiensis]AOZ06722.1 hypothetical protein BKK80_13535 [Cupriavidus malaysiensis]